MSSNVRKTGFPWEKHAVKTRIWYAEEGRRSRHGRKGRIMQSRGSWSPCLLMGRCFFHKTLPGLPIYPVLPAGFIRDIRRPSFFHQWHGHASRRSQWVPIILPEIKTFVRAFVSMCIFRDLSQGKYSWKAKPERPWQYGFDLSLIIGNSLVSVSSPWNFQKISYFM